MYREHSVAVVIPAYDEAGFVADVIDSVPDFVDRVYAVDDHSTDGTWAEIRRTVRARAADRADGSGDDPRPRGAADPSTFGDRTDRPAAEDSIRSVSTGPTTTRSDGGALAEDAPADSSGESSRPIRSTAETVVASRETAAPREPGASDDAGRPSVVGIRHDRNRGVGASIATGYRHALRDGIDVTAVMAGDGQMDPAHLDRLLDPIVEGCAHYAKGDRLRDRSCRGSMSRFRLFGNAVLSLLTKIASGYWRMLDPQNGYTAISHEALRRLDLDALYDQYGFANDVLIALNERELAIADVAMPAVYGDEESHIDYGSFVPTISKLLVDRFLRRLGVRYLVRDCHPLVGLYALGAGGVLAIGAAVLRFRSWRRGSSDPDPRSERRLLVGLTTLSALLSATTALLLAMAFDRAENDDLVVVDE
ncbi:glycosyltransferase family 2 protein [Halovivax limisalsi]|uniref:glycosyltransferase family 2 protein n=1 Tax=Halovivax limisalsi TaxID=1453760 RepID=UPI001FFC54C4|nr:glycosyltransferase family 2 protein [Halovivax limisalsi]